MNFVLKANQGNKWAQMIHGHQANRRRFLASLDEGEERKLTPSWNPIPENKPTLRKIIRNHLMSLIP